MNINDLNDDEKEKLKKAWFAYQNEMKRHYPNTVCRLVDFIAGYKAALGKV